MENIEETWVILDTETTGVTHPIYTLEVYAQKMRGLKKDGPSLHIFLNHNIDIPPESTAIHGYTREFIQQVGINPWRGHHMLNSYIGNSPVCSHNLSYDYGMVLAKESRRLKTPRDYYKGFCTVQLLRRCLPTKQPLNLVALRKLFSIDNQAHSAKDDVLTVLDILENYAFPRLISLGIDNYAKLLEFSKVHPINHCRQQLGIIESTPLLDASMQKNNAESLPNTKHSTHSTTNPKKRKSRKRRKVSSKGQFSLSPQEATQKQIAYLNALGFYPERKLSKSEASKLIDKIKASNNKPL